MQPTNNEKRHARQMIKIAPWFFGLTSDLLFYPAINMLFLTTVKGLTTQEIAVALTVAALVNLGLRMPLLKLVYKIGNTAAVRLGAVFMLVSACVITIAPSFAWIVVGEALFTIGMILNYMEHIVLKNNLSLIGRPNDYVKISNWGSLVYAVATAIIALVAGAMFVINPYLPMLSCIMVCVVCLVLSYYMKDAATVVSQKEPSSKSTSLLKTVLVAIFISHALFYGLINVGQENTILLFQFSLEKYYGTAVVAMGVSIVVFLSRLARIVGNLYFGRIYAKLKDRVAVLMAAILAAAFVLATTGYFVNILAVQLALIGAGFMLVLMLRDPFRIYTMDVVLKFVTDVKQQQKVLSYAALFRSTGIFMVGLIASFVLSKFELVYLIALLAILAIIELGVAIKTYSLIRQSRVSD